MSPLTRIWVNTTSGRPGLLHDLQAAVGCRADEKEAEALRLDRAILVELVRAHDAVILRRRDRLQQIRGARPAAPDSISQEHDRIVGHDVPVNGGPPLSDRFLDG